MVDKDKAVKDNIIDVELTGEESFFEKGDAHFFQDSHDFSLPVPSFITKRQNNENELVRRLINECDAVCDDYADQKNRKPIIPILHAQACSGATIFSKCLAVMPNTYVLSEVHPYPAIADRLKAIVYSPTDFLRQATYANFPDQHSFSHQLFLENIKLSYEHINKRGGKLLIRDHSHVDLSLSKSGFDKTIQSILSSSFELRAVVMIRDPVDSYASLNKNGWVHFSPQGFEEYCRRMLFFIEAYEGAKRVRYEDFVKAPDIILHDVCKYWGIKYSECYKFYNDLAQMTGDSGRAGTVIEPREPKPITQDYYDEIKASASYKILADKFNYSMPEEVLVERR